MAENILNKSLKLMGIGSQNIVIISWMHSHWAENISNKPAELKEMVYRNILIIQQIDTIRFNKFFISSSGPILQMNSIFLADLSLTVYNIDLLESASPMST